MNFLNNVSTKTSHGQAKLLFSKNLNDAFLQFHEIRSMQLRSVLILVSFLIYSIQTHLLIDLLFRKLMKRYMEEVQILDINCFVQQNLALPRFAKAVKWLSYWSDYALLDNSRSKYLIPRHWRKFSFEAF